MKPQYCIIFLCSCALANEPENQPNQSPVTHVTTPGPANVYVQVQNQPNFFNSVLRIRNLNFLKNWDYKKIPKEKIKEQILIKTISLQMFLKAYSKRNKYKLAASGLIGAYALLWFKLLRYNYFILQHEGWRNWKDSVPFDMLRAIPEAELGKELLFAVQQQYQKPETLNDFFSPLIAFLKDVEQELRHVKKYQKFYNRLRVFRLSFLFPQQDEILKKADEHIKRLLYLKEVFLHWVTDYKIAVNAPCSGS